MDFLAPYAGERGRERAGLDPLASDEAAANAIDDAEARLAWEFIKAQPWRTVRHTVSYSTIALAAIVGVMLRRRELFGGQLLGARETQARARR